MSRSPHSLVARNGCTLKTVIASFYVQTDFSIPFGSIPPIRESLLKDLDFNILLFKIPHMSRLAPPHFGSIDFDLPFESWANILIRN